MPNLQDETEKVPNFETGRVKMPNFRNGMGEDT